jgi:hypothetical protein
MGSDVQNSFLTMERFFIFERLPSSKMNSERLSLSRRTTIRLSIGERQMRIYQPSPFSLPKKWQGEGTNASAFALRLNRRQSIGRLAAKLSAQLATYQRIK